MSEGRGGAPAVTSELQARRAGLPTRRVQEAKGAGASRKTPPIEKRAGAEGFKGADPGVGCSRPGEIPGSGSRGWCRTPGAAFGKAAGEEAPGPRAPATEGRLRTGAGDKH